MTSGGWPGSHSISELAYPPRRTLMSDHFHFPLHPQYLYPHDTDNSESGRESNYPHPDYKAAQNIPVHTCDERGYSAPYLNDPNSPPSFQGGTYITAQNVNNRQGDTGMHILHHTVALEALYDSADSFPQPRCHPETRTEMLGELYNWLTGDNTVQSIWWLHGPAGAGKSAIMHTLCRRLQDAGRLGGAFFFKRDHPTRGNAKALFTTLAYQIAENNGRLKPMISQTVERHSSIVGREMEVQLHHLIIEPCGSLTNSPPLILLIDGLDECQHESVQSEILHLIGNAARRYPTTLRFLVASRPEAAISETVEGPVFDGLLTRLNVEQSFDDVRTYMQDEFERIHCEHGNTMGNIPTPWPSPDILHSLVQKSSGYFVYASTVIKFIDDKSFRPTERLNAVQNLQSDPNSDGPFKTLDQLYIHILSSVPLQFHSRLLDILQSVTMGLRLTPGAIDDLFEWPPGDSRLIIRRLHSLLEVPSTDNMELPHDTTEYTSPRHASLVDFLRDEGRSSTFYLDLQTRMHVTRAALKTFSDENQRPRSLWRLNAHDLCRCIVSVPPSSELVPFIQSINPVILWRNVVLHKFEEASKVLIWLKEIYPAPEDVIRRWEDYYFMSRSELSYQRLMVRNHETPDLHQQLFSLSVEMLRVLRTKMSRFLPFPLAAYHQLMVQSPAVIRIFQARWLLKGYISPPPSLCCVRLLLGLSSDNITSAVTALRSIMGDLERTENPLQVIAATTITLLALSLELFPHSIHNLLSELACGCLHLLELGSSGCDSWINDDIAWGQLVRCSPYPNSSLLCALSKFIPLWDDFDQSEWSLRLLPVEVHDIIQWLKAHPNQPRPLIARWEGYLVECRNWCKQAGTEIIDDLEHRWQSFRRPGVDPSQSQRADLDEGAVIRLYEKAVASLVEGPSDDDMDEDKAETIKDPAFNGLLLRLNDHSSFDDVSTYLSTEFSRIYREHHNMMGSLTTPWPSPDILNSLTERSSGYFVYASTVIKFIDDKSFRPMERLNDVLNLRSNAPFKALDQLYRHILSSVPLHFRAQLLDILQCVAIGFKLPPDTIDDLFEWSPGDSRLILRGLHSLLHVPPTDHRGFVSAQHGSLADFLRDKGRSSTFYLDLQTRMHVTRAALKTFADENQRPRSLWRLNAHDLCRCIVSVPPSSELVPFIQSINPVILWRNVVLHKFEEASKVLIWLKEIYPAPEDVIRRWEDYYFMSRSELSYQRLMVRNHETPDLHQQLFSLSAEMLRLSSDNITSAVTALRSIMGDLERTENPLQVIAATTITLLALSLELFPHSIHNLLSELACGCLHLLELGSSGCDSWINDDIAWGQLVRCSPYPNSSLLCALSKFIPLWDDFDQSEWSLRLLPVEFHDIIQWLKAHPNQPRPLIARWEGYLVECRNWCKQAGTEIIDDLEHRWQSFRRPGVDPSQSQRADLDEGAVICLYEKAVESLVEGPFEELDSEQESATHTDENDNDTDKNDDDMYK
ncbi:hypothetical protein C8F04DRAFT_1238035 [Mycena alexandri]|uniref:Nephrocystin 3-like N-terminal domain-containing protein n=1 Tax=Mycena alexandri TaxID=1745969 RepID=A0AAD6SHI0_9AGAR|nr:hypothetical protein C8F04DRAFT_1238035 [Mycena alexandri]